MKIKKRDKKEQKKKSMNNKKNLIILISIVFLIIVLVGVLFYLYNPLYLFGPPESHSIIRSFSRIDPYANEIVTISLAIDTADISQYSPDNTYAIREGLPAGAELVSAGDFTYDSANNQLNLIAYNEGELSAGLPDAIATYQIKFASSGTYSIVGVYAFGDDELETNTPGAIQINVGGFCNPTQIPDEISCDTLDNDCDHGVDENLKHIYYQDSDGDGYGNPLIYLESCSAPINYVLDNTDCNDNNRPDINPGKPEVCNNFDDNCVNGINEIPNDCSSGTSCVAGTCQCLSPYELDKSGNLGDCNGCVDLQEISRYMTRFLQGEQIITPLKITNEIEDWLNAISACD